MAGRGRPKGQPHTGGRKLGTPNRVDALIKEAAAQKLASAREPEVDSKDRMRKMAMLLDSLAGNEFSKPLAERDIKLVSELAYKAINAWDKVAKYEHPTLASISVTREPLDLSKLTDEEFYALHAIVKKHATDGSVANGVGETHH